MRKKIRISGLVKFANRIRNEIAEPLSSQKLVELQKEANGCLEYVNGLLKKTGSRIESLPAPSRRPYWFLNKINFNSITTGEVASTAKLSPNSVSFPGLSSYFKRILEELSRIDGTLQENEIYRAICSSSDHIEKEIRDQEMKPEHLKSQSRSIRGWLAYFAQRQAFNSYIAAVRLATPVFREATARAGKKAVPLNVYFLPLKGLYIARSYSNQTLVKLPTPMICFDEPTISLLAKWIFRRANHKQQIIAATLSTPYQEMLFELDMLGGIVERSEGLYHSLAKSFDRVNSEYFAGSLSRPSLAWSRTFTYRKFGHYDQVHDKVVVSMSLDRKDVPEYAIDFIVYHELLHKEVGDRWSTGRRLSHTSEFFRREKLFKQYEQSQAVLTRLAHPSW